MNHQEAFALLTAISGYDGREVSELSARAWAASLPEIELADALEWLPGLFRIPPEHGRRIEVWPYDVIAGVVDLQAGRVRDAWQAAFDQALDDGCSREEASKAARVAKDVAKAVNPLCDGVAR